MTALNPVMKIGAQLAESLRNHLGFTHRQAKTRAEELLASVGIPDPRKRLGAFPHELSGGMRQRVTIAIALACDPQLLIADEPTTALDVTVQAQILDLLLRQQEERGMAMILITHNLGVVAGMADQVVVMYAGRLVETGATAELLAAPRMPYTAALLNSIPRLTNPSHTRLEAISGRPPDLIDLPVGCPFAPRCGYVDARCEREAPSLELEVSRSFACWHPLRPR